MLQNNTIIN